MVVSCIKTAVFGSVFKRKTKIPEDDFQISQVVILANIHCVFYHWKRSTAWKVCKYGVFSGLYFPAFGLNTERYSVSLRIQYKCGKIRTRKTPNTNIFYAVIGKDILRCINPGLSKLNCILRLNISDKQR